MGLCREAVSYEGQAAIALEGCVDTRALARAGAGYPFSIGKGLSSAPALAVLDPAPMWAALLDDLAQAVPVPVMAARFHLGLARAIVATVRALDREERLKTVALSGGVFQNRLLFEQVADGLRAGGFHVLGQHQVPSNDGGLALGQAVVAAARAGQSHQRGKPECA